MLYDNAYNRGLAEKLHRINQNYINHSRIMGGAILGGTEYYSDDEDENVEGGNGFAAGTHNDTGVGSTLGATQAGGIQKTDMVGGKVIINTENQTLMGGNEEERRIGAGFWDDFKSGFDKVVDTVGKVADTAGKVIPVAAQVLPLLGMGENEKLNQHNLIPVANMQSSSVGGKKKINALENAEQSVKAKKKMLNAQLAFGGKKISGKILDVVNKISPFLHIAKNLLEKYDKDELKATPQLVFDIVHHLTKLGKGKIEKVDGKEGAGVISSLLGAIGLGKKEVEGIPIDKILDLKKISKSRKIGKGTLGTIGGLLDSVLGLGGPAFDKGATEEIENLPKAQAITGGKSKKKLHERLDDANIKGGEEKKEEKEEKVEGGKKQTEWTKLVKKIMDDKGIKKMADAIKYIKDNNLYKKK